MSRRTEKQRAEIRKLRELREEDLDLSDIPEVRDWSGGVVGRFYRPIKKQVTLRIDADVLAWLKAQGKGYQTRINGILREAMKGKR